MVELVYCVGFISFFSVNVHKLHK